MPPISDGSTESYLPLVCFENDVESVISEISPKPKETKKEVGKSYKNPERELQVGQKALSVKGRHESCKPIKPKPTNFEQKGVLFQPMVPLSVKEKEASPLWSHPNDPNVFPSKTDNTQVYTPGTKSLPIIETNKRKLDVTKGRPSVIQGAYGYGTNSLPTVETEEISNLLGTSLDDELKNVIPHRFEFPRVQQTPKIQLQWDALNVREGQSSMGFQHFQSHDKNSSYVEIAESGSSTHQCNGQIVNCHANISYNNPVDCEINTPFFSPIWRSAEPILESPSIESDCIQGFCAQNACNDNTTSSRLELDPVPPPKVTIPCSTELDKITESAKRTQDSDLRSLLNDDVDSPDGSFAAVEKTSASNSQNNFSRPSCRFANTSDSIFESQSVTKSKKYNKDLHRTKNDQISSTRTKSLLLPYKLITTANSVRCSSDSTTSYYVDLYHSSSSETEVRPWPSSSRSLAENRTSISVSVQNDCPLAHRQFETPEEPEKPEIKTSFGGCLPLSVERASPVDSRYFEYIQYSNINSDSGSDTEDSIFDSQDIGLPNVDDVFTSNSFDTAYFSPDVKHNQKSGTDCEIFNSDVDLEEKIKKSDLLNTNKPTTVTDDDWRLAEATIKSEAIGSSVPLLKEELRYKILQRHGHQRPENWDLISKVYICITIFLIRKQYM